MLKKMTTLALLTTAFWGCDKQKAPDEVTSTSNPAVVTSKEKEKAKPNKAVVAPTFVALTSSQNYIPTNLTSNETQVLFDALNPRTTWGVTQCYKRAHVWTHDLSVLRNINPTLAEDHPQFESKYNEVRSSLQSRGINGINSMKVYIMFNNRLQMECDSRKDCKWFFHVAPYVISDGAETVIDRGLFNSPLPLNIWAKNLIGMGFEKHTGRKVEQCRVIDNYAQYDDANNLYRSTLLKVNDLLKEFMTDEMRSNGRVGKAGTDLNVGWVTVKKKIQRHEYTNEYLRSIKVPESIIAQYDSILSMDLCQLRKVPMYYYDPRSVEYADKLLAAPRTSWLEQDLEYSYDEFKEGRDEY
jgi:hypothetical protein